MTIEEKIANAFNLKGDNWMKHANPWSIWTRFATLPFLILAIWSRSWIGWYSLIPILILIVWLIINPTLFKKPKSFDNWGSKSVLGEKFWSQRKNNAVPKHHSYTNYNTNNSTSNWWNPSHNRFMETSAKLDNYWFNYGILIKNVVFG